MRHLFFSISLSVFIIGCGGNGGSGGEKSPILSTSSSSSLISGSSGDSSFTQSSLSISSFSSNNSSTINSSFSSALSSSQSSLSDAIPFTFTSSGFVSGGKIPLQYSCFGGELSPQLQWDISSSEIKSFVLIMEDYDAIALVGYPYVHWNIYNIPADTRTIAEGATLRAMPGGSVEGVNDDGVPKYSGPCPPEGTGTHRYFFALYALNKESLPVNTSRPMRRNDFETQYASAIIQKAEITGSYLYK
ncbi:YbhB/YbcL family Raf kinase inhibitor-like protein [Cellvibrio mixtus]|uniref:YbhB/YbcL family Raf kinase inhibitor-like protein n=1 Tax=Cellvibrio mixtus TaxID=39650 RepID=UPI0009FF5A79|nr:YbhB/YbcL family Raf kinase inhibitor-like protein [Cellvibrio mixtus]